MGADPLRELFAFFMLLLTMSNRSLLLRILLPFSLLLLGALLSWLLLSVALLGPLLTCQRGRDKGGLRGVAVRARVHHTCSAPACRSSFCHSASCSERASARSVSCFCCSRAC